MLYIKSGQVTIPVVDMLIQEQNLLADKRARLQFMTNAKSFTGAYQVLLKEIEEVQSRVDNYKRILAAHNETVGSNGDTYLNKVAGV